MAEFRINIKECIRIKKEFTATITEMKNLEKRLYAVKDNLSSMSEYKDIVSHLDRQCQELTEERKDVEKLLQTFSDCVQCYENAEKKVKEQEVDWHLVLDMAGTIPGIGAVFDGVNTAWYAAEGDWSNALLSGVAFVPGIGEAIGGGKTAVKAGGKVIGHLDDAADVVKTADKVEDAAKAAGKVGKAEKNVGKIGKYVDEAVQGSNYSKYMEQLDDFPKNKISHIIEGSASLGHDHKWDCLVEGKDWDDIKKIICAVMENGVEYPSGSASCKVMNIKGYDVEVRFKRLSDGTVKISDAFVR